MGRYVLAEHKWQGNLAGAAANLARGEAHERAADHPRDTIGGAVACRGEACRSDIEPFFTKLERFGQAATSPGQCTVNYRAILASASSVYGHGLMSPRLSIIKRDAFLDDDKVKTAQGAEL